MIPPDRGSGGFVSRRAENIPSPIFPFIKMYHNVHLHSVKGLKCSNISFAESVIMSEKKGFFLFCNKNNKNRKGLQHANFVHI